MRERNTIELKGLTAEREDKIVVMPFCQQDVEMHDHDFFELAYITGGSALHTISDADGEMRSGEVGRRLFYHRLRQQAQLQGMQGLYSD